MLAPTRRGPDDDSEVAARPGSAGAADLARLVADLPPLSRTLLLPIVARAREDARASAFRDPVAATIVRRLEAVAADDLARARRDRLTAAAVVARAIALDRMVAAAIARRPERPVVNLGAGLDTRRSRLDRRPPDHDADAGPPWFDLDLESACRLREAMLGPAVPGPDMLGLGDGAIVTADVRRPGWDRGLPPGPLLLVAEGLLPFLARGEVDALVADVARHRPGSELVADVVGPVLQVIPRIARVLRGTGVRFAWSCRRASDLERAAATVRVLEEVHAIDVTEAPWGAVRRLRRLPEVRRTLRFVRLGLGPAEDAVASA